MVNRVEFVRSKFLPIGENVTKKVPTGEKKKGIFGGEKEVTEKQTEWVQTGYSDSKIDDRQLAQDVLDKISELNDAGYKVVSTQAFQSGDYSYNAKSGTVAGSGGWGWGYGYGYSYTSAIMIIAEKI